MLLIYHLKVLKFLLAILLVSFSFLVNHTEVWGFLSVCGVGGYTQRCIHFMKWGGGPCLVYLLGLLWGLWNNPGEEWQACGNALLSFMQKSNKFLKRKKNKNCHICMYGDCHPWHNGHWSTFKIPFSQFLLVSPPTWRLFITLHGCEYLTVIRLVITAMGDRREAA